MALCVPASDPVHKATIIPRGRALGMVMQLPESDKLSFSRDQMVSRMAIMMGGRVAEELIFGHDKVTSGASSDIEQATRLSRAMVTRWGMSEKLGTVAYSADQEEVFLGHSVSRTQNISGATAKLIDEEIRRFVDDGYQKARQILTDKIEDLHIIGRALLEFETLSGDEIKALLRGEKIVREPPNDETQTPRPSSSSVPSAGRPRGPDLNPEPQPG